MPRTTAPTPDQPGHWVITKFGPPSVLQWMTYDVLPKPSEGEILIRILVAGIAGPDNIQRAGGYPDPRMQKPGFTPGYDFAGVVETVGPGVSGFSPGEKVASMCMMGAHATHIVLPASDVIKLKNDDDLIKITALPLNYMTAYGMLKRGEAKLQAGSSILIGSVSGGVGTAMAQLVKAFDMDLTMYGTCSPSKFDFVKSLGVTPIDRHSRDIATQVRKLNGGRGVDVSFDAVGSKESVDTSLAATENSAGHVMIIGVMAAIAGDGSGMVQNAFNAFEYASSHPNMSGFSVTHSYYFPKRDLFLSDFNDIADKVREGKFNPFIGKLFRLDEAVKANEMLVSGQGVTGKMEYIVDAELAAQKL